MTANDRKSYLGYWYLVSIVIILLLLKAPIDNNYSALQEEVELSHKSPKLKLVIESGLLSIKIFWQR